MWFGINIYSDWLTPAVSQLVKLVKQRDGLFWSQMVWTEQNTNTQKCFKDKQVNVELQSEDWVWMQRPCLKYVHTDWDGSPRSFSQTLTWALWTPSVRGQRMSKKPTPPRCSPSQQSTVSRTSRSTGPGPGASAWRCLSNTVDLQVAGGLRRRSPSQIHKLGRTVRQFVDDVDKNIGCSFNPWLHLPCLLLPGM